MKELIRITEQDGKRAVNARELHMFLDSKQDFSNWIKGRINKFQFVENQDFILLDKIIEQTGQGGHNKIEYAITIDMAKELAMVENNEKGRQARRYFIEIENNYHNQKANAYAIPTTFAAALRLAADTQEQLALKEIELKHKDEQIKMQSPKVLFADTVIGTNSSCSVSELAKYIAQSFGRKCGQNKLFEWFRNEGYLGTCKMYYNLPNQRYVAQGLFEIRKGVRESSSGEKITVNTTLVTEKGQFYFINLLKNRKDKRDAICD